MWFTVPLPQLPYMSADDDIRQHIESVDRFCCDLLTWLKRFAEAVLEKNTPLPFRAAIGEAVANRKPGRAKQIILQLLETVEAARQTRGEPPMTLLQKRLLIAFAATRLVLMSFADQ